MEGEECITLSPLLCLINSLLRTSRHDWPILVLHLPFLFDLALGLLSTFILKVIASLV